MNPPPGLVTVPVIAIFADMVLWTLLSAEKDSDFMEIDIYSPSKSKW
jgi:hypothetical protein